MTNMHYNS